jgi:hypothetical protein
VELAGIGLQFEVQAVWSCPSDNSNYTLCGAAIEADQSPAAHTWRAPLWIASRHRRNVG